MFSNAAKPLYTVRKKTMWFPNIWTQTYAVNKCKCIVFVKHKWNKSERIIRYHYCSMWVTEKNPLWKVGICEIVMLKIQFTMKIIFGRPTMFTIQVVLINLLRDNLFHERFSKKRKHTDSSDWQNGLGI